MKVLLPRELRGSFLLAVLRPAFLLTFCVLLLTGDWLGKNFLFEPPVRWLGDYLLRQRNRLQAQVTRIVRIDDIDRRQVLGGQSPVNGIALVNAVCKLEKSSPAVIVVDIDTESEESFPAGFRLPTMGAPIVWAVDADWEEGENSLYLRLRRVIGGRLVEVPLYGIARMPVGFDGVLRGWARSFFINGHEEPSLPSAAVDQFCKPPRNCSRSPETVFSHDYLFATMNLRDFAGADSSSRPTDCPVGKEGEGDPRLAGKTSRRGSNPISS